MSRLVPNPLGDLLPTLERVEKAIREIPEELTDVRRLPLIHEELITLNATMAAVLDALQGLRLQGAEPEAASTAPITGR